ncbi:MAG: F0F1 ATP synthase subunit delta [Chitinophagaceae bacterium]|nr:MAG: F0F1 ATP synthase subunit delta [Chitinophagaceae bacterium]
MFNPRLATRYAKSLIGLAIERNEVETVYADINWLRSVTKSNRDFVNVLRSPVIPATMKKKIIEAVTGGNISAMTSAFMTILITKGREINLPEILDAFITQYKEYKNIHTVQLTTATPIDDQTKQEIIEQVKKSGNFPNIEIDEKVDPDIIGGFVLQMGDTLVDASISYDLNAIKQQFLNNDFIYNIR